MTVAILYSRASFGIQAPLVTVEAHLPKGMPGFHIVGLPAAAVKESRDRVRAALVNSGFEFPIKRITVNLAPADLPKEGGRFDLPIALGILAASGQIPLADLGSYEFIGELALSGELRAIRGILPLVLGARRAGRALILPSHNAEEAALVESAKVYSANHLLEVIAHLKNTVSLPSCVFQPKVSKQHTSLDLNEVSGQEMAKRALEIAAAGKHNLLLIGPPGTGKTMLASRLTSLLPLLSESQALEVAAIASVSQMVVNQTSWIAERWRQIPFRAPHHSASSIALVGGGRPPRPGEISLAHEGILFLDELPEFSRHVLDSLREPLESGYITISRAGYQTQFPANFQLIAAMNPCPCGYAGSDLPCRCSREQVQRYLGKLSGPFLDRIDMQVLVARLPASLLIHKEKTLEDSRQIRERVLQARHRAVLKDPLPIDGQSTELLTQAMEKFTLSARSYHRILRIAQTIANLADSNAILSHHVAEALTYRYFDRTQESRV